MNTAIFDMDGVLIDSEPLWRMAEQRVFKSVGIRLNDEMCMETMGCRTDEVVAYWYQKYPWNGKDPVDVEHEIVAEMERLVSEQGRALEGVYDILKILQEYRFKIGLASSSAIILINAVIEKLDIRQYFRVLHSAEDEESGKPNPAVYLTASRQLNAAPRDCVAFEDSIAGVRAAKSAGMKVIAIPAADQYDDIKFNEADIKLKSLKDFSIDMIQFLTHDTTIVYYNSPTQ